MTFEPKLSGTKVTGFKIKPIFDNQFVSLDTVIATVHKQETMNWILDKLRFTKGDVIDGRQTWWCIMDWDTIYAMSVLENYPEYEKEFVDRFGEKWYNHYIRFNH